jgi:CheY-like chemotaxis protein
MRKARILCVDDNAFILNVLQSLLESSGYVVVPAERGEAAVASMGEPFDAAIVDYELPDTNGIRLAKYLRNMQPDLPVILFSGREDIPTDETREINAVVSKADSAFRLLAVLSGMIPEAAA